MPKGGIPDRWEDYTNPMGDQIPGTRFITFKVPLHPRLCNHLKKEEQFTPSDLLRLLDDRGRSVGQIIDLTQTNRYYDPTEFQDNNIEHIKIATRGHVVPDRRTCKRFAKTVDKFLEENKENDLLIGVHCTHGVNRTGYLVCRYMIDKLDFQPENAIEAFNTARGYEIERENYLGALKNGTSDDYHRDEDDSREQWRPRDRHNPCDHDLAPHRHSYQDYQGHQRPRHEVTMGRSMEDIIPDIGEDIIPDTEEDIIPNKEEDIIPETKEDMVTGGILIKTGLMIFRRDSSVTNTTTVRILLQVVRLRLLLLIVGIHRTAKEMEPLTMNPDIAHHHTQGLQ